MQEVCLKGTTRLWNDLIHVLLTVVLPILCKFIRLIFPFPEFMFAQGIPFIENKTDCCEPNNEHFLTLLFSNFVRGVLNVYTNFHYNPSFRNENIWVVLTIFEQPS